MSRIHPGRPVALRPADGAILSARAFEPACPPRAAVVVLGALGVPQGYYRRFARSLADDGFLALTFDYRGIAGSARGPARRSPATLRDWGTLDAPAAVAALHDLVGDDVPHLGVAHSFGAQTLGLSDGVHALAGLITIGSGLPHVSDWPGARRAGMHLVTRALLPGLAATLGHVPGWAGVGEDLPAGVAADWARWLRTPGYFAVDVPEAPQRLARVRAPVDVLHVADDAYAPEAAVDRLAAALTGAPVTRRTLSPGRYGLPALGHFGPFRAEARLLWRDLADRLGDLAAAPAAAPRRAARA